MTDQGEPRPGGEAQTPDGHLQESASDPGPSDAPKEPGSCAHKLFWYAVFCVVLFGVFPIAALINHAVENDWGQSEDRNDSAAESTATDQAAVAPVADQAAVSSEPTSDTAGSVSEPEASISDTEGPISGTWAMYWTNSLGSESQAFTITFTGSDTGTLEVLNDDTESQTSFTVEGDQVRFKFTRTLDLQEPYGTCPEGSTFDGTLTGRNDIVGKWARQGWEGSPDGGCSHTGDWSPYEARLIRMSE